MVFKPLFVLLFYLFFSFQSTAHFDLNNLENKFIEHQYNYLPLDIPKVLAHKLDNQIDFIQYTQDSLPESLDIESHCKQHIQLLAISVLSYVKAQEFFHAFNNDKRLTQLNICVLPPLWLEQNLIECKFDNKTNRASCDYELIKSWLSKTKISHLAMVLDKTKAYTYQGIMYLDLQDTYDVFVHELAHFAGFMDEYPLSQSSAMQHCHNVDSINLLSNVNDSKSREKLFIWKQTHKQFEIARSRTCEVLGIITYKPSTRLTFLEFHDTAEIPEIYLALWRYQLKKGFQFNLMRMRMGLPLLPTTGFTQS